MHPMEKIILRGGCAILIALYAASFVADVERLALHALRFGWPD